MNVHDAVRHVCSIVALLCSMACVSSLYAQPDTATEDISDGLRLMEGLRDGVFSFDDPAFYWFCRHVQRQPNKPNTSEADQQAPLSWRFLMERPSDYRGKWVSVEGVLQSRVGFKVTGYGREDIGTLYQCELTERDTRSFCTVVAIDDPLTIPLHSRVQACGYFMKIRGYQTNDGVEGRGPLLVVRQLELVHPPAIGLPEGGFLRNQETTWIVIGVGLLAVVWLGLRRAIRSQGPGSPPWTGEKNESPSADDFDWLTKAQSPDRRKE